MEPKEIERLAVLETKVEHLTDAVNRFEKKIDMYITFLEPINVLVKQNDYLLKEHMKTNSDESTRRNDWSQKKILASVAVVSGLVSAMVGFLLKFIKA